MNIHLNRHLPVKGTFNVRDLGGYATPSGETRWRRVLRADGLHRLDDEGMGALVAEGVTTVIDLRHPGELETQPNPFHANPAVRYHNVSLFDQLAPTPVPGQDILLELYKLALDNRQSAVAEVLTIIAEAPEGAVLFHCTAGKDRTGIVSALLLAVAGVEATLIVDDYALTGPMIAPMVEEIIAHAVARGADIEAFRPMLASEPATMLATIAHIETNYGSASAYLERIGMDVAAIERLRQRLVGDI
ncbi:tyrosine-protein phosphatase [Devosia sp. XJ19-1]|uniref:Tyrosine-protein phosphatase n=1 Tax=Devosia ureilytica TaxID=2952754 RepID=A0A9Q4AQ20_9HYPH|nr:tyrosine-protein phosphatase [Devosia ureilytica]MCP8884142.1 tyrosine-protein phosphatase [Devosia ureilytica]MCP8887750.1 tyrosine-protein phosphatase [Devosia ureilytica]